MLDLQGGRREDDSSDPSTLFPCDYGPSSRGVEGRVRALRARQRGVEVGKGGRGVPGVGRREVEEGSEDPGGDLSKGTDEADWVYLRREPLEQVCYG